MPGEPKNKQNNIPIEVLQQLNKKRVADSRLFFDWIFHRSQAIQAEINQNMRPVIVYQTQRAYQTFVDQYGRPRTFLVQQSVPVYVQRPQNQMTHPEIYGPSNAFKTMFVQNSKELKNEFGKDKLWELAFDQKDMWFASNTDSPQMKTLKNSIRSFSFYLNRIIFF